MDFLGWTFFPSLLPHHSQIPCIIVREDGPVWRWIDWYFHHIKPQAGVIIEMRFGKVSTFFYLSHHFFVLSSGSIEWKSGLKCFFYLAMEKKWTKRGTKHNDEWYSRTRSSRKWIFSEWLRRWIKKSEMGWCDFDTRRGKLIKTAERWAFEWHRDKRAASRLSSATNLLRFAPNEIIYESYATVEWVL